MAEGILEKLREAVLALDSKSARRYARRALESGIDPVDIVENALRPGLESIGREFEASKVFLPELVAAGDIASEIGGILERAMVAGRELPSRGSVALGTVKGDIHSIGKNIVGVMMRAEGFRVIDMGVDVSADDFVKAAAEVDAIALSGVLAAASRSMKEIADKVSAQYPARVIITGGAAINPELAMALGVLYGPDAARGVKMLGEALQNRSAT